MTETVEHPQHYNRGNYEAWDVLDDWFPNEPLLWQAGKYLSRLGEKDDPTVEVGKMINYLNRWLEKSGYPPVKSGQTIEEKYPDGCFVFPRGMVKELEFSRSSFPEDDTIQVTGFQLDTYGPASDAWPLLKENPSAGKAYPYV